MVRNIQSLNKKLLKNKTDLAILILVKDKPADYFRRLIFYLNPQVKCHSGSILIPALDTDVCERYLAEGADKG